jgi:glutamate-1-semialdehyde 2,1-aminomutase
MAIEMTKPLDAAAKVSAQRDALSTAQSQQLYRRAKQIIPGGTQLLSKRPEMFAPDQWPAYYRSALGCEIIDLDGNKFLDMSTTGIGACLLGYADPDVTSAVVRRVQAGSMCTLNPPEEVQLAELLVELHPWAENVRFVRTGGEAMAAAVRLARAASNREVIAFCGYHGWHDWYLAANRTRAGAADALHEHLLPGLSPAGVPSQLAGTTVAFAYNKLDELLAIVQRHGKNLAAIVMEPTRSVDPDPGFLAGVRELCDRSGAALIFDEITAGWRFTVGGVHLRYGLDPDIAVFAKALGNGHPMAALVGRAWVMQAAHDSFVSSTYWTEGVGPIAALATIRKFQQLNVPDHVDRIGKRLRAGLEDLGRQHAIPIRVSGYPALTSLGFEHSDQVALTTLLTARMLDHGILSGSAFYPTWSHQDMHIDRYLAAADAIFSELADAIKLGNAAERIGGPIKHVGFARLA